MNRVLVVVGVVFLVVVVGVGAFFGGMAFQRGRLARAGGGSFSAAAAGGRGGIVGQIQSVGTDTLVISTAQGQVTVSLSNNTPVSKMAQGSLSDLQPGETVSVRGQRDSSGNVTATQIQIVGQGAGNSS
ncbi:MAG: DUF5666 domain-containing protein [Anaerolineales bacterium]|jgi:RNase P/RNase MRP subunit p29